MIGDWFVHDHTLCVEVKDAIYFVRPCNSWDGRFTLKKIPIEWFTVQKIGIDGTLWTTYAIPYLMFGKVVLKDDDEVPNP